MNTPVVHPISACTIRDRQSEPGAQATGQVAPRLRLGFGNLLHNHERAHRWRSGVGVVLATSLLLGARAYAAPGVGDDSAPSGTSSNRA